MSAAVPVSSFETGTYWWAHMDASRSRPGTIMVCGTRTIPSRNATEGYVDLSTDYGRTWREVLVDGSTTWVSEESCAFGPGEEAYFLSSSSAMFYGLPHHNLGCSRLYVSRDAGTTWHVASKFPFVDYTSMAVAGIYGANPRRIYLFANYIDVSDPASGPGLLTIDSEGADSRAVYPALLKRNGNEGQVFSATPTASAVLEDGTAASAFRTSWSSESGPRPWAKRASVSERLEFVRSADGGQTLASPTPISASVGLSQLSEATMAVDRSTSPHKGRIYAAWAQNTRTNIIVMLAWSDDGGIHWRRRRIEYLPDPPRALGLGSNPGMTPPAVAVNNEGTVGLFWLEKEGRCPYFSESEDAGGSFTPKVQVALCQPSSRSDLAWYSHYLFAWPDTEASRRGLERDEKRIGVRIEMRVQSLTPTSMVADDRGNFHAMWLALRQGGSQLWTTAIAVADHPLTTEAAPGGREDVSSSVALEFTNTQFDQRTKALSVDLMVVNRSTRLLEGPLLLLPTRIESSLGPVTRPHGVRRAAAPCQATPDSYEIQQSRLAPGERTSPVRMRITLGRVRPTDSGEVTVSLRVCGCRR